MDNSRFAPHIPLPLRAFTPGEPTPRPNGDPAAGNAVRENESYWFGWDLLLNGFPWEAHEVWEPLWRARSGSEKSWLQGLIRIAAALVKSRAGNAAAVSHHVAGALVHWRGIPLEESPHGGEILPLLTGWLERDSNLPPQTGWLVACSTLKPGEPGPILFIPEALFTALWRVFQRETASNSVP